MNAGAVECLAIRRSNKLRSMLGVWKWGGEMCGKSRQVWLFRHHRGEPFLECFDLVRCHVAKLLGEEATVDLKRKFPDLGDFKPSRRHLQKDCSFTFGLSRFGPAEMLIRVIIEFLCR